MNHYELLGVPRKASAPEIKHAFRRLAKQWHPDRNDQDPLASDRFRRIAEAYHILTDAEDRATYDGELDGAPRTSSSRGPSEPLSYWLDAAQWPALSGRDLNGVARFLIERGCLPRDAYRIAETVVNARIGSLRSAAGDFTVTGALLTGCALAIVAVAVPELGAANTDTNGTRGTMVFGGLFVALLLARAGIRRLLRAAALRRQARDDAESTESAE